MIPATMFPTTDVEPREIRAPRKMETPWKAGDEDPGRKGKAMIKASATPRMRMIL